MQLRSYQQDALHALSIFWHGGGGNPLIAMAAGTGKSVVIAFLLKQLLFDYPKMRVLITAPNRELIDQNVKELRKVWFDAPIGINCDGLGFRDTDEQILFVSINSIYRDPQAVGRRELIVIDECHFIPHHDQGMYRATLAALRELVPDLRVAGLTATPYRLDRGHLCEGEGHIFDSVVYEYSIAQGIRDGVLAPLSSKATTAMIDVSGVGKRGGEFIADQLEAAAIEGDVVERACDEITSHAGRRRAWLVYCAGVAHAGLVRDALRAHGLDAEMVLGETTDDERDRIIEDFRAGRLTCLVSVMLLSYGFNVPHVDLVCLLRPTWSAGLYVQQVGRGTRQAPDKADCLVLDFAGNVRRFGPVDDDRIKIKSNGKDGGAPTKICPSCQEIVMLGVRECLHCGYVFPKQKATHDAHADNVEILSSRRTQSDWLEVEDVCCFFHRKEIPSLKVSYQCGVETYSKWVCLEHAGWARVLAEKWWRQMTDGEQPPATINEALARQDELMPVTHIRVAPSGKFWEIVGYRLERDDGSEFELDRVMNPVTSSPVRLPEFNDEVPY